MRLLRRLLVGCLVGLLGASYANEGTHDHDSEGDHSPEEVAIGVGPGKAVEAASKAEGIQLSEKALKTLALRTQDVSTRDVHRVPSSSLVYYQDEVGIYRLRQGRFKLLDVEVQRKSSQDAQIRARDLRPGDKIVIHGAAALRLAELEAFGGSGEGHGH